MSANTIRVACLGYVFDPLAQTVLRGVAPPDFELIFVEKPDAGVADVVADSDFVLCVSPVTDTMMAGAPRLRLIQKWGIGVDKIDLAAAERHGIHVSITAGANASVVAEHTMMLMLAAMRRVIVADRAVRQGIWSAAMIRPHARRLGGKTVGILGLGNIGRAVAKRLSGFDVRLLYNDIKGPFADAGPLNAAFVSLDTLLAESDVLTLHIPGGAANLHIIDAAAIARMKPGAILVNAARGELVDETALEAALQSGHLLAAALDTVENEPLRAGSPLREMDNTVLTPHAAGGVVDNLAPMAAHAFRNMQSFLRNEPLALADWVVIPRHPKPGYTAATRG